ncbi:YfbM family protein [Dactylosporangium sp. NPDC049742]|uniref:YfbM family protein n=1 Tax=Dactylosporangium sp. NPDC049742 TaxID=3154737 RepID=UPI003444ECE3
MGCRGVFFALTAAQDGALTATQDDAEVRAFVHAVEAAWDDEWLCETDKAWDAMHRCLGDGTLDIGYRDGGPLPLTVLGGRHHHEGEEYVVAHVLAADVAQIAEALRTVDETWLRDRYHRIDPDDYQGVLDDDDSEYTWSYLQDVRDFYQRAAVAGRSVIFTVDQ